MKDKHPITNDAAIAHEPRLADARIIKFRAWGGKDMLYSHNNITNPSNFQNHWFFGRLKEHTEIMQFTGFTDKNGKEIYEGDLLSDPYPIDGEHLSNGFHESFLPVVWCCETGSWCVDASYAKDGSFLTSMVEYFGESLEVKGNIYENADLLAT